ncbi:MAG TPA: hypothetical protein VIK91_11770 [Nannocystis sp.]
MDREAGASSDGEAGRAMSGPSRSVLAQLGQAGAAVDLEAPVSGVERMLAPTSERLGRVHRRQIERDRWPDFASFDPSRYDAALRREAARQWAGRARAEHGSIHQFSALTHVLCEARVGVELLGALARLITDEVRHADLCARMALACDPTGPQTHPERFTWPRPRAPWPDPPRAEAREEQLAWAACAILIACCLGETLSRPMLEALVVVTTDPVAADVSRQILRDEHLHAAFGWDALGLLLPALDERGRARVQAALTDAFGGFEATAAGGHTIEEIAGRELILTRGEPNLGTLTSEQFAIIFYATIEQEILPALAALGLDGQRAWAERPRPR